MALLQREGPRQTDMSMLSARADSRARVFRIACGFCFVKVPSSLSDEDDDDTSQRVRLVGTGRTTRPTAFDSLEHLVLTMSREFDSLHERVVRQLLALTG